MVASGTSGAPLSVCTLLYSSVLAQGCHRPDPRPAEGRQGCPSKKRLGANPTKVHLEPTPDMSLEGRDFCSGESISAAWSLPFSFHLSPRVCSLAYLSTT